MSESPEVRVEDDTKREAELRERCKQGGEVLGHGEPIQGMKGLGIYLVAN